MTDNVFAALADPTRRTVFSLLVESGPASATRLADRLPVSRQAVAKHLAVLEDAGLVTRERAGRETRFAANPAALEDVARWIEEVGATWEARLRRLQDRFAQ
ncbi:MAG: metalloregulator ArsR/SmtB family transcription factor [Actinomycetes bacterium]|jgi:DNA-binding transcriptional ArsR family regulator|nr:MAG: transcriptional regulator [Actinomycetota bacterium]